MLIKAHDFLTVD